LRNTTIGKNYQNNEKQCLDDEDWLQIEETTFKARFKKSPLLRSKLKGIQRNIEFLKQQKEK
jgi:epoxyqueuosine reductase QueG